MNTRSLRGGNTASCGCARADGVRAAIRTHGATAGPGRRPEYLALLLAAATGMMLTVTAGDLIVLFIGIELLSVSLYILAAIEVARERSLEAVLRYLRTFDGLPDHTDQIFVVDEHDQLEGSLPLDRVLINEPEVLVTDVMKIFAISPASWAMHLTM